jgi:hypothetical protein
LVPRSSGTPVAMWAWPTWVVSRIRVLEVVFILLKFPCPSRRIFIGSHSLPPLWFAVSVLQRRQLALRYPVRACLLLFRASLHRRHRVWVRKITTFEISLSKSLQRSPPNRSFQVPRPLRLLLQAPGRVRLHLLHLREVPLLRLGQVYVTILTRTTSLVSLVEPSKAISTSPLDPSSLPHQD